MTEDAIRWAKSLKRTLDKIPDGFEIIVSHDEIFIVDSGFSDMFDDQTECSNRAEEAYVYRFFTRRVFPNSEDG